jgi:hypothetical protein
VNQRRIVVAALAALFLTYAPTALASAPVFYSPATIAPLNPQVGTTLTGGNGSPVCSPSCNPNAPDGQPKPYMTILPSNSEPPVGQFFTFRRCNNAGCTIVQPKSGNNIYVVQPADAGSQIQLTVTVTNLDCAITRSTDGYTECRYTSAYSTATTNTVAGGAAVAISPGTLPDAVDGNPYSQTLTGANGSGPYSFSISSGALPPGLTLTGGGSLNGTPTTAGSFSFTVSATGIGAAIGTKTYALSVHLGLGSQTPAPGTAGTAYSQKLAGDPGGAAPFTFTLTSGSLPPGLSLSGDTVSGTPTKAGTYTFNVSVSDANHSTGDGVVTVNVAWPTLNVAPASLDKAVKQVPYNVALTTTGGVTPYTYTLLTGTLPAGLTLSPGGVISGTPSGPAGDFTITVGVQDANGAPATATFVIHYLAPDILVNPVKVPPGVVGTKFRQRLLASGGHGPYTFEVKSGKLPSGVTLGEHGLLIGTPTKAGTYRFVVKVTDKDGAFTTQSFTIVIKPAALR